MPRGTKYVPVFGSQLSDSPSGGSQPEKITASTASLTQRRRDRPLTKQANVGLLKIKLPKFRKVAKKPDKSSRKWTMEAIADASVCREEAAPNPHTGVGPGTGSTGSTGEKLNEKEKAKLAVLRTISKLLQENQLIRQRLVELSKTR